VKVFEACQFLEFSKIKIWHQPNHS